MSVVTSTDTDATHRPTIAGLVQCYVSEQTVQQGWSDKSAKRVKSALLLFARYLHHKRFSHLHLRPMDVVEYFAFLQSVPARHTNMTIAEIVALNLHWEKPRLSAETRITHLEYLERFLTWAARRRHGSHMFNLAWALAEYERKRQGGRIRKGGGNRTGFAGGHLV